METTASQLQWSKKNYALREFISKHRDALPVIARVTAGYSGGEEEDGGDDDTHNITKDSIFFIYAIELQLRVVVRAEDERYISMSRFCPLNFHVILNDGSPSRPRRLKDIIRTERNSFGDLRLSVASQEDGGLGPLDDGYSDLRGTLRVLDLYDEKYLLGHTLNGNKFCTTSVVSIPSYLPLTLAVSVGRKNGSKADFFDFIKDVGSAGYEFQREFSRLPNQRSEEIVVFTDPPNGQYEYIEQNVSRVPSFKVVNKVPSFGSTVQGKTNTATRSQDLEVSPTSVPPLPPRNRRISDVPQALSISTERRPLPSLPVDSPKEHISNPKPELKFSTSAESILQGNDFVSRKSIPSLKAAAGRSLSRVPAFLKSDWNVRPSKDATPSSASSDLEVTRRGRSTGIAETAASKNSRTSGQTLISGLALEFDRKKQKDSPGVGWSAWPFSTVKRKPEGGNTAPEKPPVPQKPFVQPTVTEKPENGIEDGLMTKNSNNSCHDLASQDEVSDADYDEIETPVLTEISDHRKFKYSFSETVSTVPNKCTDRNRTQDPPKSNLVLRTLSQSVECLMNIENEEEDSPTYEEIGSPFPHGSLLRKHVSGEGVAEFQASRWSFQKTTTEHEVFNFRSVRTKDWNSVDENQNVISLREEVERKPPGRSDKWEESGNEKEVDRKTLSATKQHWKSVDDIPDDISSLSVEEVSNCLQVLNLGQYIGTFREHQIDGTLLSSLDKDVLVSDFGFRKFDAIKLIKFATEGWRPKVKHDQSLFSI